VKFSSLQSATDNKSIRSWYQVSKDQYHIIGIQGRSVILDYKKRQVVRRLLQ